MYEPRQGIHVPIINIRDHQNKAITTLTIDMKNFYFYLTHHFRL